MNRNYLPTACCVTQADNANHLAMAIGEGPAESQTWITPLHQDKDGNQFIVRNLWVSNDWLDNALGTINRPEWDTDELVDLNKAHSAQESIILCNEEEPPAAKVGHIITCTACDMETALKAWGLELIPQEDET